MECRVSQSDQCVGGLQSWCVESVRSVCWWAAIMVCPVSQISVLVGCNHGVSSQSDQCVGGLQSWCVQSVRSVCWWTAIVLCQVSQIVCWWAAIMVCPVSQINVLMGCNHGVSSQSDQCADGVQSWCVQSVRSVFWWAAIMAIFTNLFKADASTTLFGNAHLLYKFIIIIIIFRQELVHFLRKLAKIYGKCPKLPYFKVYDKMANANSADLDQTAPSDQVLHCLPFH